MRKFCLIFLTAFLCIGFADAATRTKNSVPRQTQTTTSKQPSQNRPQSANTTNRAIQTRQVINKESSIKKTTARNTTNKYVVMRPTQQRQKTATRSAVSKKTIARAAGTVTTRTFGENYTSCRDSYFTCMDQFCAIQNESYRRCVCSSKIKDVQSAESKLSQTKTSLQDFQNYNIDAISKTAAEVTAMGSASEGEKAIKKDKSESAKTLNSISAVLSDTKQKSSSKSSNPLDGMKAVWSTTDLIGGTDLANLTGEALYNAVHAQCAELVKTDCGDNDLKMVASAYGMYIENDCMTLLNTLDGKKIAANAEIRSTRHQMQDTRLENYDAHNSLSINDCIAKVRENVTSETACGTDYVHCLDVTGKYLNYDTGEPIYSKEFYQFETQITLSGDVVKNNKNRLYINALNDKRIFADTTLGLCADNADNVWDEFLRQAIVEIQQRQQQRVRKVKDECLKVVNECYLNKSDQIKSFSDNSSDITLGQTLELSEDMCTEKLDTCSNLYGGGPEGFEMLVNTMTGITDVTIAQTCPDLLQKFVTKRCAVSSTDSVHKYPYGCRTYTPGDSQYAQHALCNSTVVNPFAKSDILVNISEENMSYANYSCQNCRKIYVSCNIGYYLYADGRETEDDDSDDCRPDFNNDYCYNRYKATQCQICPVNSTCIGGKSPPSSMNREIYAQCGMYYIGSLYHEMVRYALQNCVRPSNTVAVLPEYILSDVDKAFRTVQSSMVQELSAECERYEGIWVDIPWADEDSDGKHDTTGEEMLNLFYSRTSTSPLWGYCKPK